MKAGPSAILCGERVMPRRPASAWRGSRGQGEGLQCRWQKSRQTAPVAVSYSKSLIQAARHNPPAQNLIHEREAFVKLFDTEDQREGVQAFLEKRQPTWQNK